MGLKRRKFGLADLELASLNQLIPVNGTETALILKSAEKNRLY